MKTARDVPGFPSFRVSAAGTVWGLFRGRWRRRRGGIVSSNGVKYRCVILKMDDGKDLRVPVHKLVLLAFHGPRPAGQVARWRDGDRLNCRADNLSWGPRPRGAEAGALAGVNHPRSIYTADQVRSIREGREKRVPAWLLAKLYGGSKATVERAARGVTYRDVGDAGAA